ncbi:MAG TPA: hypothetical protein VF698_08930 [Thermoanaerobaculia bacterium]|jgi:hypothetical protein
MANITLNSKNLSQNFTPEVKQAYAQARLGGSTTGPTLTITKGKETVYKGVIGADQQNLPKLSDERHTATAELVNDNQNITLTV